MGIVVKALIGALVVVLIGLLAKSRSYYIAGLVPLFPTFALIAHYIVGSERSIEALRTTLIFGMWAVLPYLVYLISLYFFINSMRLSWALAAAVLCWIAAAWLLITLWGWWQGRYCPARITACRPAEQTRVAYLPPRGNSGFRPEGSPQIEANKPAPFCGKPLLNC